MKPFNRLGPKKIPYDSPLRTPAPLILNWCLLFFIGEPVQTECKKLPIHNNNYNIVYRLNVVLCDAGAWIKQHYSHCGCGSWQMKKVIKFIYGIYSGDWKNLHPNHPARPVGLLSSEGGRQIQGGGTACWSCSRENKKSSKNTTRKTVESPKACKEALIVWPWER